mmetsp:Transcript_35006/g.100512  ORF Transcript_35006/g.100512 Transcript_35006/m.100512 type:complete len:80 (+) Transcript_35006:129-368(+)
MRPLLLGTGPRQLQALILKFLMDWNEPTRKTIYVFILEATQIVHDIALKGENISVHLVDVVVESSKRGNPMTHFGTSSL